MACNPEVVASICLLVYCVLVPKKNGIAGGQKGGAKEYCGASRQPHLQDRVADSYRAGPYVMVFHGARVRVDRRSDQVGALTHYHQE